MTQEVAPHVHTSEGGLPVRHQLHTPPRISDRTVPRPRVTDWLLEQIEGCPVVQVVAPAGSGKTTAVVQATEALGRSVTWLTLDEWHRSPGRLLDDLAGALEHVAPGLQKARAGAEGAEVVELAAIIGSFMHRQHALLVIDDCHLVRDVPEAVAVIGALFRRSPPGLHVVLVGRTSLPFVGLGLEAVAPDASVGDEILRATQEEAAGILRAHDSSVEVGEALQATGGWIAGLVFETWRAQDPEQPNDDPLRQYLEREVRPRLAPDAAEFLVASSAFDEVNAARAEALGVDDPRSWLSTLREAGLPAVWAPDGSEMRLHPRIREFLRDELRTGPLERRRSALRAAAGAHEREGDLERALELFLEIGATAEVQRLLPEVILDVVERHDVALAERYLASVQLDPEPATVVLARLSLASLRASLSEGIAVVDRLVADRRLAEVVAEEPAIGALACNVLAGRGSIEAALDVLDGMPPGRPAEVARLMMSAVRDDPEAPIPSFGGDVLDAVLARALYHRGRLRELHEGRTAWAESTGAHALAPAESLVKLPSARLVRVLGQFEHAIALRDIEMAEQCVAELEQFAPWYQLLADAELAIRLLHDPVRASIAVERLRGQGLSTPLFYRELIGTWEGAARLLGDEPDAAAAVLRETVASMRRGDRTLVMASALVYLAEAEWRLGNENASDRATDEAYEVGHRQGSLRVLSLALADFPGVLSRRLDTEAGSESPWHALGRALVAGTRGARVLVVAPVAAHLREFGEPALVVGGGRVARPKIRKSLELLSFLLASAKGHVSRETILTALWNGRDDNSTRAYLRQALRHLRDVLPDGISVAAVGDSLSVEGAVTSESLELEALLAVAARDPGPVRLGYLLEALELAGRGEFLEGSSDVWWVDDRRARLASVLSDARLDAAESLLDTDQHLRALALVDEVLDADPLLERAWRLRMRTLGLLGDYDGVLAAYAACKNALAEIGVEPSSTTSELARSLRR